MIKENMFYGQRTINEYREIHLEDVLFEYLLFKGTRTADNIPINRTVLPKELVSSALYIYELKSNPTNTRAMEYYCERQARQLQIMGIDLFKKACINIPTDIWEKADMHNKEFTKGKRYEEKRMG